VAAISTHIRIGARRSTLSQRQVALVQAALEAANPELTSQPVLMTTTGDRQLNTPLPEIGGKGVFTAEIEAALLAGEIDLAVHSLKDLPVEHPDGIAIGAVLPRADPGDVLISRSGARLAELPEGAVIGTSSHRRAAQIRRLRPDVQPVSIRGNVETRLRKGQDPIGPYDAILLARAGLERLDLLTSTMHVLPLADMLPAPGQAALAVQCRDDAVSRALALLINHHPSELAVSAERAFLAALGGGCTAPVACAATWSNTTLHMHGRVLSLDGQSVIDVFTEVVRPDFAAALAAGKALADDALHRGADRLLAEARS
jgi:hydroxymethylbilane synthase